MRYVHIILRKKLLASVVFFDLACVILIFVLLYFRRRMLRLPIREDMLFWSRKCWEICNKGILSLLQKSAKMLWSGW